MKIQFFRMCTLVILLLLTTTQPQARPHSLGDVAALQPGHVREGLSENGGKIPLQFTSSGHVLGFAQDGIYLAGVTHVLHVQFINAQPTKPSSASPASQASHAAQLAQVTYPNLWPGVTLTYDAPAGAILRSTYRIDAFADAAQIRLRYNAPVQVERDGTLTVAYATGAMHESAPLAWQEHNGIHEPVAVAFHALSSREVGFALGAYDPASTLFIDPTLTWNTFLGGNGTDYGYAIAVDGNGNVYVAGYSSDTWGSPIQSYAGGNDAYAAKLDSNGALTWNTFLGGSGMDEGYGIAVDGNGNVYVAGSSNATWGSPVRPYTFEYDAFAAKLDSNGGLTWNTFLGGSEIGTDYGRGIAVDGIGNVYVAGYSDDTWGSPARTFTAGWDAFAAKLDNNGGLTWNTFVGGSGADDGYAIAVDGSGNVYVAGYSNATWGSPVRPFGSNDAFAAKLDSSGGLTWNTFLGGSGSEMDEGNAIAADGIGNVYVAGYSNATWGSPIRNYTSGSDTFAVRLDSGGGLTWNTFLGGSGGDNGRCIALDGSGNVYVAGNSTATWGFPTRPYTQRSDAYAAKLNSSGGLTWNTFLGGDGTDGGSGIAVSGSGNVYVSGYGNATWGSPIHTYTNDYDAFAVKLLPNQFLFLPLIMR